MSNSNFYHLYKEKGQILGISHNPCQHSVYRIIVVFVFGCLLLYDKLSPHPYPPHKNLVIKTNNRSACL